MVTFYPHRMQDTLDWLDARVAVLLTEAPNHVVAVLPHGDNRSLRIFDNDSVERQRGTFKLMKATDMTREGRAVAITASNSHLAATAVAHTHARCARRIVQKAREPQVDEHDTDEDEFPAYHNPVATRAMASDSDEDMPSPP